MSTPSERDKKRLQAALRPLVDSLGWTPRFFTRGSELMAAVALENDRPFEEVLWIFDTEEDSLRCLLICRTVVPPEREKAIVELCARVNEGIVFGCLEYSFDDRTLTFRNAVDVKGGKIAELAARSTTRVLSFGSQYEPAIQATLDGSSPAKAVAEVEESS